MEHLLSSHSTIRDVVSTLDKPEEYIRIVLGHLSECRRANRNAQVRIGIMGKGVMPCHRIEYKDAAGQRHILHAWDGKNKFADVLIHESTWSDTTMTLEEVQTLLGELRGFKGIKK